MHLFQWLGFRFKIGFDVSECTEPVRPLLSLLNDSIVPLEACLQVQHHAGMLLFSRRPISLVSCSLALLLVTPVGDCSSLSGLTGIKV